jgi:hypothetical protein
MRREFLLRVIVWRSTIFAVGLLGDADRKRYLTEWFGVGLTEETIFRPNFQEDS